MCINITMNGENLSRNTYSESNFRGENDIQVVPSEIS